MSDKGIFEEILNLYGFFITDDYTLLTKNKLEEELLKSIIKCDSELEIILSSFVMEKAFSAIGKHNVESDKSKVEINSDFLILSFAYIEEGLSYYSLKAKNKDLAYKLAKKSAVYNPECKNKEAYVHYLLGRSHIELETFKDSIHELNASLKLEPKNTHALVLLGMGYDGLADYCLAEEYFMKSLNSNPRESTMPQPDDIEYQRNYQTAMFYYKNAREEKAIPLFEKCIRLNPKEPMLYLKVEMCYENLGKYPDALQCIRFGLMQCPENKALKSIETRLFKKV